MLRAGIIRPLGAGIYSFLPFGYRVVKKVIDILRDEMDAINGQEFHLPALNPIELWEATGRVKAFGDILFHLKNRPFVLAPTHEEVICHIAKNHIRSYRDLPQIWYQIQTKFRNEPRPRSGVIRARQFLMKDSYSLDSQWEGLDKSYDLHAEAYKRIFTRLGLKFFVVGASSGAMGGTASQEFMVESEAGEDTCIVCDNCDYAANLEVATSKVTKVQREDQSEPLKEIHTPDVRTIDELKTFLNVDYKNLAKSLVYFQNETPILILMEGNDQLNESKLMGAIGGEVRPSTPEELKLLTGADAGSIGPVGLKTKQLIQASDVDGDSKPSSNQKPIGHNFKIIADKRLENANNMIGGANKNDYHLANIDFQRDFNVDGYYDLRVVQPGEPCSHCNNPLRVVSAIELGHIFKLGTKYSEALNAYFLDEGGKERPIIMGSYGIGVERIIACHIEQNHDRDGIIWNKVLAPFHVHLLLVNSNHKKAVETAEHLYEKLQDALIGVLFDDRNDVTPGFKFKDADLLGMPLQIIVGEKNVIHGNVEIKERRTNKREVIEIARVVSHIEKYLEA